MKKIIKKIAAIVAVVTVSCGAGINNVYANELQENHIAEPVYDIAPGLDLTNEDVDNIIENTITMGIEEGLSDEEIKQLISVWYNDDETSYSINGSNANRYLAKQFFTALTAKGGQPVNDTLCINFEYGLTVDDNFLNVNGYTLYNDSINTSNANVVVSQGISFDFYVHHYQLDINNLGSQSTSLGNIVKFDLSITDNRAKTGIAAYERIANNSCLRMAEETPNASYTVNDYEKYPCNLPIDYDEESSVHIVNFNVGAYGDVAVGNGEIGTIDSYDAQYVLAYVSNSRSLNPIQKLAADVDRDGSVTSSDALQILNYATGKITSF